MTATIKAFVQATGMVDNRYPVTAVLGELSAIARTYGQDIAEYDSVNYPGLEVLVFKSQDDTTGNRFVLTDNHVTEILKVVQRVISYAGANVRPYNSKDFVDSIISALAGQIRNLKLGETVENGTTGLPGWVSWESNNTTGTIIKIWLSDQAFRTQYDEYINKVVPIVPVLDTLFGNFAEVSASLDKRQDTWMEIAIARTRDNQPETVLRLPSFAMVNRANPTETKSVMMPVLVYGQAGDNVDAMKDAIVEYVLANSTKSRAEWTALFPSLFKRTEFVMVPNWRNLALSYFQSSTDLSGVYSPIINPREMLPLVKSLIPSYPATHIETKIEYMSILHRSIAIAYVPGENNLAQYDALTKIIPDYALLNTGFTDFNRLSLETRDWIDRIQDLVTVAETVTTYTAVPNTMRKIYRDGRLFVSMTIGQVNYLVAARSNTQFA